MSIKLERLGHIFTEEISRVLMEEIKDENIKFVTITYVKITADLSFAKVYFTVLEEEKRKVVEDSLNKASNFIRSKLFDRVEIRKMPELLFVYDDSIEYASNIEKIIDELKEEEKYGNK